MILGVEVEIGRGGGRDKCVTLAESAAVDKAMAMRMEARFATRVDEDAWVGEAGATSLDRV